MTNQTADELLDSVKGKFDHVVVVGLTKGVVDVATTIPTYQFAQWMLTRGSFELLIAEKAQVVAEITPPAVEVVNDSPSVS